MSIFKSIFRKKVDKGFYEKYVSSVKKGNKKGDKQNVKESDIDEIIENDNGINFSRKHEKGDLEREKLEKKIIDSQIERIKKGDILNGTNPLYGPWDLSDNYKCIIYQDIEKGFKFEDKHFVRRMMWNFPEWFLNEEEKDKFLTNTMGLGSFLFNMGLTKRFFEKMDDLFQGEGRINFYDRLIEDVINCTMKCHFNGFLFYGNILTNIKAAEESLSPKDALDMAFKWRMSLIESYKKYEVNRRNPRVGRVLNEIRGFLQKGVLIDGLGMEDVENLYDGVGAEYGSTERFK